MQRMRGLQFLLGTLALAVVGCGGPVQADVARLSLSYPSPFVAKRIRTPLYVLLREADVPDEFHYPAGTYVAVDVVHVRSFVGRDVSKYFSHYFETVKAVTEDSDLPSSPHYVAEVRVTKVYMEVDSARATSSAGSAVAARGYGAMDWALGLRRSGSDEFALTFADKVVGTFALINSTDGPAMFASMFEVALIRLAKAYDEGGVHRRLVADDG